MPGGGSWLAGRRGEDVVVRVPVGTIVREVRERDNNAQNKSQEDLERDEQDRLDLEWAYEVNRIRLDEAEKRDARWTAWKKRKDRAERAGNEEEEEQVERWQEVDEVPVEEHKLAALKRMRKALFVLYPLAELEGHPHFLRTEHQLLSQLLKREIDMPGTKKRGRGGKQRRRKRTNQEEEEDEDPPLYLDLSKPTPLDSPILLARGGHPGLGNPSFLSHEDRSPKYATRGGGGESIRIELEVKSIGEVGLVGLPNAGKRCAPTRLPGIFPLPRVTDLAVTCRAVPSCAP